MHMPLPFTIGAKLVKLIERGKYFFLRIFYSTGVIWILGLNVSIAQNGLIIEPKSINLGKIISGSVQKISFSLINYGDDTLSIYAVNTSCSCSEVRKNKRLLGPKERDSITVEFNTFGFRGLVMKSIEVISNDKKHSIQNVTFTADIFSNIETSFQGDIFWIGNISAGSTTKKMFSLKNNSNENIFINSLITGSNIITFSLQDSLIGSLDSIMVTINITPSEIGLASEEFTINTSNQTQPTIKLVVTYNAVN